MWISLRTIVVVIIAGALIALGVFVLPQIKNGMPNLTMPDTKKQPDPAKEPSGTSEDPTVEILAILDTSDRVRAQHLTVGIPNPIPDGLAMDPISKKSASGQAVEPTKAQIDEIVRAIKGGQFEKDRSTNNNPSYVVRFVKGENRVDVLLATNQAYAVLMLNGQRTSEVKLTEQSVLDGTLAGLFSH